MPTTITDLSLSQQLSSEVFNDYGTALEFIHSYPDYSLLKFREVVNTIVKLLVEHHGAPKLSSSLIDRINYLSGERLISKELVSEFHKARKLGNVGVHKEVNLEGDKEFFERRKLALTDNALKARELIVSIMVQVYSTLYSSPLEAVITLAPIGMQDYKEALFNAAVSPDSKLKLKAGVICEAIRDEHSSAGPIMASNSKVAHLRGLSQTALSFYEAAYKTSAPVDIFQKKVPSDKRSDEELQLALCDLEPLYKYAYLATTEEFPAETRKQGLNGLKVAADRGYGPAEAYYGATCYENEDFDTALKYLTKAEQKDEPLALRFLFYFYTDNLACQIDSDKGFAFLDKAIELGCSDSLATKGMALHKGNFIPQDEEGGIRLLEESATMGSALGNRYLMVDCGELTKLIMDKTQDFTAKLMQTLEGMKPKPSRVPQKTKRNDICHCEEGQKNRRKYKKCCLEKDGAAQKSNN